MQGSSAENANEWAVRANERSDELLSQYFRPDSGLFWTIVPWLPGWFIIDYLCAISPWELYTHLQTNIHWVNQKKCKRNKNFERKKIGGNTPIILPLVSLTWQLISVWDSRVFSPINVEFYRYHYHKHGSNLWKSTAVFFALYILFTTGTALL